MITQQNYVIPDTPASSSNYHCGNVGSSSNSSSAQLIPTSINPSNSTSIVSASTSINSAYSTANKNSYSTTQISSIPSTSSIIAHSRYQPSNALVSKLPVDLIEHEILPYVDQFDLVNLSLTCSALYLPAIKKLYRRVTVVLDAELPLVYDIDHRRYISENGMTYMDSALIFTFGNLLKFIESIQSNVELVQLVKYFVFDKCHQDEQETSLTALQSNILEFFAAKSQHLNFFHISFVEYLSGIKQLTDFLKHENIRQNMFKLVVTSLDELYTPNIPRCLTNLFLMMNELELKEPFDLSEYPYDVFNSLFTLTCSTSRHLGLEVLQNLKLCSPSMKLKLKGLTVFHRHKEITNAVEEEGEDEEISEDLDAKLQEIDKKLSFTAIESKIDLKYLSHLYLKVDCNEHRHNMCNCYESFFNDFAKFSLANDGLPNLINFEAESFPNLDWLRPHQQLENILTPLGGFIKTLGNLSRLTIDFSTPGFKMFDNNLGLSTMLLNKLNEHLMEAFFLCFFTVDNTSNCKSPLLNNLRTLQLPDFFTSFIYYKPDFMESLLHTCKCWGCQLVLEKLKDEFFDEQDENGLDIESTYYMLVGYILGKLQADREVCIPIKEKTFNYSKYPIYKGQPHTLHQGFHSVASPCNCNLEQDPLGVSKMNIDNLVTTYIVHQLAPIIEYLSVLFVRLDNLMIHGIYYERKNGELVPNFDEMDYPEEFIQVKQDEINGGIRPEGPFGNFRGV
ncbi:uncharacterized protein SPAPADRAFT_148709 [Spathaspora passalidarum NRRL Y-27907]|uniref:F-box domain-containing protein n=1 Tax=Spathaspora passalidarum (strain NRRL Y-27907 / 11-Y1) TaxID=619300 RepID=G3AHM5_SPAPN|nr:uncharacterized protein SPAPADRAFT_148709 [Spathaspora passalidarum NRRL Y-27907]EGW34189.1 hypothetical protein SPAPADRAFT_148709 [Spathaspora passalidarum NRRL Y-27907]